LSANLKLLVLAMGLIAAILGYIGYDRFAKSQIVFGAPIDARELLRAASTQGPLLVRTAGSALGLSAEALNARVVEKLRGGIAEPWLQLETDAAKTRNPFSLVYAFDMLPDSRPNFAALCAGTQPPQDPQSKNANVHVVLCGPNGPVLAIHGWTIRPATADDAALDRTIVQTGLSALRGDT
jgi:hypothetical protein